MHFNRLKTVRHNFVSKITRAVKVKKYLMEEHFHLFIVILLWFFNSSRVASVISNQNWFLMKQSNQRFVRRHRSLASKATMYLSRKTLVPSKLARSAKSLEFLKWPIGFVQHNKSKYRVVAACFYNE